MYSSVIKVDSLSKCYRIGVAGRDHTTIREAIMDLVGSPFRNLAKLRRLTDFRDDDSQSDNDVIWALKNASFEVGEGEVLGIIGRNGAGKSTLLKILSRITEPSGGTAELYGKVASLLEVGAGFHPELTGRENVFLSGAVLGMRKREIERKFDEIVAFSEIEKFLDTPVKKYSSGMYNRLAFSVAAHLEPDILLIDEVLAVGDLGFQKKCLGKMGEVARGGRTVLFVSHNMGSIRSLCENAVWLDGGRVVEKGPSEVVVRNYEERQMKILGKASHTVERRVEDVANPSFYFQSVEILNTSGEHTTLFKYNDIMNLIIHVSGKAPDRFSAEFRIYNEMRVLVATGASQAYHGKYYGAAVKQIIIMIGPLRLTSGEYTVSICAVARPTRLDTWDNAIGFTVTECQPFFMPKEMPTSVDGVCVIDHSFSEA